MTNLQEAFNTPWKAWNWFGHWMIYPAARLLFAANGIRWGKGWHLYGLPIIQKHRRSEMYIGPGLSLRSSVSSNPLGPNHRVILCTWQAGAVLEIGDNFAMTGGSVCAAERVKIGSNVAVGANCTIVDTDFHPLNPDLRRQSPQVANTDPILIEDDVFIGMNCLILKGVRIGRGSVIGAGSVVTKDVPACVVVAGNPAHIIRPV